MMEAFKTAKDSKIRDPHIFAAICKHLLVDNKLSQVNFFIILFLLSLSYFLI